MKADTKTQISIFRMQSCEWFKGSVYGFLNINEAANNYLVLKRYSRVKIDLVFVVIPF